MGFKNYIYPGVRVSLNELLQLIVAFALIDSVDPCVYTIFALIVMSTMLISSKYAVRAGAVFIASVYLGYVAFGALLRYAFIRLPMTLLVLLLLVYGSTLLLHTTLTGKKNYTNEFVCRENDVPCKVISALRLGGLVNRGLPVISVLGLISSFTLLPCSAGLYVAFNIVTKNYEFGVWLLSTLLYVFIFVSPLILLFLALVYVSRLKAIYNILLKHERLFKTAGALLMMSTAIYMLLTH